MPLPMISLSLSNRLSLEIMKKSKIQPKSSKPIPNTNHPSQLLPIFLLTPLNLDIDKWLLYYSKEILSTCMEISLKMNKNCSEIYYSHSISSKHTFSFKKVLPLLSVFYFLLFKLKTGLSFKLSLMRLSDLLLNLLPHLFF